MKLLELLYQIKKLIIKYNNNIFKRKREEPIEEIKEVLSGIGTTLSLRKVFLETSVQVLEINAVQSWLGGNFDAGNKLWRNAERVRIALRIDPELQEKVTVMKKKKKAKKTKKIKDVCQVCGNRIPISSGRWKFCSMECYERAARIRMKKWRIKHKKDNEIF